jgi:hypothetical protein
MLHHGGYDRPGSVGNLDLQLSVDKGYFAGLYLPPVIDVTVYGVSKQSGDVRSRNDLGPK